MTSNNFWVLAQKYWRKVMDNSELKKLDDSAEETATKTVNSTIVNPQSKNPLADWNIEDE